MQLTMGSRNMLCTAASCGLALFSMVKLSSVALQVEAAKAAAEAQSASPSSSGNSAHEAEVQQSTKRPKTRGAAAVDPGQEVRPPAILHHCRATR